MSMNQSPIYKYYNYKRTDYGINSLRRKKVKELVLENSGNKKMRILDVGCSEGYLGKEFRDKGHEVIGIDISEQSIQKARQVLDGAYEFDLEQDEWPDILSQKPFDIIICAEVLEHLFDQETFLQKIKHILKDQGRLIITTPNFLIWNNRIRMLLGQFGPKEVFFDEGHIHLLSYYGLCNLMQRSGYNIEKESHVWYPNRLENLAGLLPANLFVYQSIIRVKK